MEPEQFEATVNELQTQMTAVQAAIEGNSQSSLFKPRPFSGSPSEDVNEWLSKFERFSRFYSWSNAKKLGAVSLLLDGAALAWYHTQSDETKGNFTNLTDGLKERFGPQTLEFLFRQELYSRKQGENEPLSLYTEDIIKKSQRLSITDKDMLNIFINGLQNDLKSHVILNQPKTFAEAENLARLRDSVSKTGVSSSSLPASKTLQDQRIKELEGQVNLLLSLATEKKNQTPKSPAVQAVSAQKVVSRRSTNPFTPEEIAFSESAVGPDPFQAMQTEIIAAIQSGLSKAQNHSFRGNPPSNQGPRGGARGRNLRTTNGQPICNLCQRVGHVARYCWFRPQSQQQFQSSPQQPPLQQTRYRMPLNPQQPQPQPQPGLQQQFQPQYFNPRNLNEPRPSQWGQ